MSTNVKSLRPIGIFVFIFFTSLGLTTSVPAGRDEPDRGIRYQTVADYIHDIIEADRTLYTTHVVDRMQETGTAIASEG
jgi:hypothetical protein